MPEPEQFHRWYKVLLPMVERGGGVLTLFATAVMIVSIWWLGAWTRDCVAHNRLLTEKMLAQQQTFYAEFRLALANCPPGRP